MDKFLDVVEDYDVFLLLGVVMVFDVMCLLECGYEWLKFFLVEQVGGFVYLKFLLLFLVVVKFCLIGGVSFDKVLDYFKLLNVLCVGGLWIVDVKVIVLEDWVGIEEWVWVVVFLID